MKLIPLSDFVIEQEKIILDEIEYNGTTSEDYRSMVQFITLVTNYTKFIKQPLTLGMFVPVDEDVNVLKEPVWQVEYEKRKVSSDKLNSISEQYKKAKEKVLFEGFILNDIQLENKELRLSIYIDTHEFVVHHENGYGGGYIGDTVENLANCNLQIELTPSALEAIGIKE